MYQIFCEESNSKNILIVYNSLVISIGYLLFLLCWDRKWSVLNVYPNVKGIYTLGKDTGKGEGTMRGKDPGMA